MVMDEMDSLRLSDGGIHESIIPSKGENEGYLNKFEAYQIAYASEGSDQVIWSTKPMQRGEVDESAISWEHCDDIDWSDSDDEDEPSPSTASTNSIGILANGSAIVIPPLMAERVLESIRESSYVECTAKNCEQHEVADDACIYGRFTTMMLVDLTDSVMDRARFRDVQKRISDLLELQTLDMDVPMFDQSELEAYCYQFGRSVAARLRCIRARSTSDFDDKVRQLYKIIADCKQRSSIARCCFRCITRPFARLYRCRQKSTH